MGIQESRVGRQAAVKAAAASRSAGALQRAGSFLRVLGPGLITGASDDDPSGIGTYSQVGAQFGLGLLWTALFSLPLMAAVQELCARIALQTGVGLGVSLRRKFPTALVGASVFALLAANTINIGADLGAVALGGEMLSKGRIPHQWLLVPVTGCILALLVFKSYAFIFKTFKWLTLALFAYIATAIIIRPDPLATVTATIVPHVVLSAGFVTAVVAVLGTTISPYLFFWQASSVVDAEKADGHRTEKSRRGTTTRELRRTRADVLTGMFLSQLVMYCIVLTSGTVLHSHGQTGVQTATDAAAALQPVAGPFAFILFAVGLIGVGLLAIPVLSASGSYALEEFAGWKGGLDAKPSRAPSFYIVICLAMLVGLALNFVGVDPIKALFLTAVVNGVVAPPLLILIILLGSDRRVMEGRASGLASKALTWAAATAMTLAAAAMLWTLLGGGG